MIIESIYLKNFRNYEEQSFAFAEDVNVICGENAQGKTNLLESIFLLSCARSFHTSMKKELIRFGEQQALVLGNVHSRKRKFELKADIREKSASLFYVNGVKCKRQYEICGVLNAISFTPDDLNLMKEGASLRRKFLNDTLCQLRPAYAAALSRYMKFLQNKQKILKDGEDMPSFYDSLDDFSAGMAKNAAIIIKRRAELCKIISKEAEGIHSEISGAAENLSLTYKTCSAVQNPLADTNEIEQQIFSRMLEFKSKEISSKQCLIGSHRDDVLACINDKDARAYASQGQHRTAALSIKLAQRQVFFKDTGEYPVLLLDDVLSELDNTRQNFVLNKISGGQVFITCCEVEKLKNAMSGKAFLINQGKAVCEQGK